MSKVYKCQYCSFHGTKEDLIEHVDDKHEEMIPEGFSAGRAVFNYINKKTSGVCVVCKRPTEWNESRLKYNRLCGRKECSKALRDTYSKNMIKVHGTDNLLNDPERQESMLKNRKISGKYKFADGGYHVYTGSYEHKTLEFLDKVLGYKSNEILAPGPILDYEYAGKHLKWITDIYIIPYNLIIEVKDGGDNKNNREMISYREKQVAKENSITKLGKFNYLRLTNNNFEQLLGILMKLKMQMIDTSEEDRKPIININEEVDYVNESLLNKISNPITFFHASLIKYNNFIPAQAPCFGSKIDDEYWAVYMWDNIDDAYVYLINRIIVEKSLKNNIKIFADSDNDFRMYINRFNNICIYTNNKKYIENIVLGERGYIYSITPNLLDLRNVRFGHDCNQNEYTLTHDAKIDACMDVVISKDILNKYIIEVSKTKLKVLENSKKARLFSPLMYTRDERLILNYKYNVLNNIDKSIDHSKPLKGQIPDEMIVKYNFKMISEIFNQLPKDEQKMLLAPGRKEYIDSPRCKYRYVYILKNQAVGFIELFDFDEERTLNVSIAVLPEYRGAKYNIAKKLLEFAIQIMKKDGYSRISYMVYKNNYKSIKFIKKQGFVYSNSTKTDDIYIKDLNINNEEADYILESNKNNLEVDEKIKWVYSEKDKEYNAYALIDGDKYRVRVEALIVNDNNELLCAIENKVNQYGVSYKLPGGGIEPDLSLEESIIKECKEEIHMIPNDLKYAGKYILSYNGNYPEWHKNKLWPLGLRYEGVITYIFTAKPGKKYNGYIRKIDRDEVMNTAKFVDIDSINLRKEHKEILMQMSNINEDAENISNADKEKLEKIKNLYKNHKIKYGMLDKNNNPTTKSTEYILSNFNRLDKYKVGTCWDQANYNATLFEDIGFKYSTALANNTYCLYFIQEDDGKTYVTHTWLAFKLSNKVYIYETAWAKYKGIHEYNNEKEMLEDYVSKHNEGNYEYYLIKYKKYPDSIKTPDNFLEYVYDKGQIIHKAKKNNISESTSDIDYILESHSNLKISLAKKLIKECIDKTNSKFRSSGVYLNTSQDEKDFLDGKINNIRVWRLKQNWSIGERLGNLLFGNEYYVVEKALKDVNNSGRIDPLHIHWIGNYINISINKSDRLKLSEDTDYILESDQELKPIYIIFTYTNDIVNKLISKFTHGHWGHVGISFDESLEKIYTFSMNVLHPKTGFNIENLDFYKRIDVSEIVVFRAMILEKDYKLMKDKIKFFNKNIDKTSYGYRNFISNLNKVKDENELSMICSGFVDLICSTGNIKYTRGSYSTVNPNQMYKVLSKHKEKFEKIYRGSIDGYKLLNK